LMKVLITSNAFSETVNIIYPPLSMDIFPSTFCLT
jgi:hypothetical protein